MRTTRLLAASAAVIFAFGLLAGCPKEKDKEECGNGILEGLEECDNNTFYTEDSCQNEGFYGGSLSCTSSCTLSMDACHNCGDGYLDAGEDCDTNELGTNTCVTEGYELGDLGCNNDCTLDTTECYDSDCTMTSFTTVSASAITDNAEWYYEEIVTIDSLSHLFVVDLWDDAGPLTTGNHELGTGNETTYNGCMYCVYVAECSDSACSDVTDLYYFATEGTLVLTTLGQVGGTFDGGINNVIFSEWDDANDEALVGGDCLDVDAWSFSLTPVGQANWQ